MEIFRTLARAYFIARLVGPDFIVYKFTSYMPTKDDVASEYSNYLHFIYVRESIRDIINSWNDLVKLATSYVKRNFASKCKALIEIFADYIEYRIADLSEIIPIINVFWHAIYHVLSNFFISDDSPRNLCIFVNKELSKYLSIKNTYTNFADVCRLANSYDMILKNIHGNPEAYAVLVKLALM